jgi:hypothetical protein
MADDADLRLVIGRIVSRVLADPISAELLDRMRAYGSPEKFLIWWFHHMGCDSAAYARTLTDKEIAESLDYNAACAKTDMVRAIMIEAARRLRDDRDPQFVVPNPPVTPTLKAYARPEE